MTVTDVVLADGEELDDVLAVAGALEVGLPAPGGRGHHPARRRRGSVRVPTARKAVALDGLGMRGRRRRPQGAASGARS